MAGRQKNRGSSLHWCVSRDQVRLRTGERANRLIIHYLDLSKSVSCWWRLLRNLHCAVFISRVTGAAKVSLECFSQWNVIFQISLGLTLREKRGNKKANKLILHQPRFVGAFGGRSQSLLGWFIPSLLAPSSMEFTVGSKKWWNSPRHSIVIFTFTIL